MILPEHWYIYLVIGLFSGILSGTFGVGAGILIVPALVHLSFPQKEAQGIALAVMVPMALVGALRYKLNPDVHMSAGVILCLMATAVVGAYLGASLAASLSQVVLRKLFAIFVLIVGARMLFMK